LASYFRVPALFKDTKKFIEDDMGPYNINYYLKEAKLYQDDEIICATMKVAVNNWLSVFAPINNASKYIPSQRLYLEPLPQENQVEVKQLALQRAGSAYRSFKRVPSLKTPWKQQDGGVLLWFHTSFSVSMGRWNVYGLCPNFCRGHRRDCCPEGGKAQSFF
jgi:hypothetical protein